jgi:hypothetical protein
MWAVGIVQLATSVDEEAPRLAEDVGVVAYEARARLTGEPPHVVLGAVDEEKAKAVAARLVARGHSALAVDLATMVTHDAMTSLRAFTVSDAGLMAEAAGPLLPWGEVVALLRGAHPISTEESKTVKSREFSLGLAVASSGLMLNKTVERVEKVKATDKAQVLYLVRKSGPMWFLHEQRAQYGGLGPQLKPARMENFETTVKLIRAHAPHAVWDDRLMRARRIPDHTGRGLAPANQHAVGFDLLAHVLAGWALRG